MGMLAHALLGAVAGGAGQMNDNWREKTKQAREDALYTRRRLDQQEDYQTQRKDKLADDQRNRAWQQEDRKGEREWVNRTN